MPPALARVLFCGAALAGLVPFQVARAQQTRPARRAAPPTPATAPVSRAEYERLRTEVESLRKELAEVRKDNEARGAETDTSLEEMDQTIAELRKDAEGRDFGTANFLLSGNATISYFDRENDDSTFGVVFRPLFLWKLSDRLLFEAKPEIRLRQGTEEISVTLEYADLSFVVHDAVIVGAGKFLTPFGLFPDRFYPGKLLEEPLVYQRGNSGLVPHSEVGAFARGAFPVGSRYEANYAAWISNGPALRTDDPARLGLLDFGGDFRDGNDNKAVGARVGFLPFPALEVGASIYHARVEPDGFQRTSATLYGLDLQYVETIKPLGTIDARAEWVWSDVEDATYDASGALGVGPLTYDNRRNGGYVEVGYRPSLSDNKLLRDVEFVGRYDFLDVPAGAPGPGDEQRVTAAVLYWVTATTALSAGYVVAEPEEGPDRDVFYLRASVGF